MKKYLPLLIILLLLTGASSAYAAIAVDSSSTLFDNGGGTHSSITGNTITVTGSNTLLFIGLWSNQNVLGYTCSYNSVSMTEVGTGVNVTAAEYLHVFYLLNPTTGSALSPSCTYSSITASVNIQSFSYTGVSQSGFPDASITHTGGSATSFTSAITTVADNSWIFIWARNQSNSFVDGTNATTRNQLAGQGVAGADTNAAITPAGSTNQTLTWTGASVWGNIQVSFAPAVAAVSNAPFNFFGNI